MTRLLVVQHEPSSPPGLLALAAAATRVEVHRSQFSGTSTQAGRLSGNQSTSPSTMSGAADVLCMILMPESVRRTRTPQSARNVMGRRSTSSSRAEWGVAVSVSTASRSRNRLPPAPYREIHRTFTPSSRVQADTIESVRSLLT